MNRALEAGEAQIAVRAPGWTLAVAAFAIAVMVLLAAYWPTVRSLVWVWGHDGTYQYAYLIFPLSAWVAFNLRDQVRVNSPVPSAWGLVSVAVLALVWYAGNLLDFMLPQHFAFVSMFPALVLACWGWRALWVLVFPLAYLVVFAVPWGDGLVGPLQDITARFAVHALELTGTPVLLNGREIMTPTATWMVEQACSGVKFFIACSALGCLYAYLMYQRWWKRVIFVVLAAVVPIVANGLRVYFTILIGEAFGMKYATGTDHLVFGWQFFGTVLVLLLVAGWFFRDRIVLRQPSKSFDDQPRPARRLLWFATIALLIVGPAVAAGFAPKAAPEVISLSAPALSGWQGPESARDAWRPSFRGAAGQMHVFYRSSAGAGPVELFHAVYTGKPRDGHNLITYGNNVYDPERSRVLSTASQRVDFAGGRSVVVGELRLTGAAGTRLVWYWYCVDSRCTRSPAMTKLLQAWDVLRGHLPKSSVWALSSPITSAGVDETRTELRALAHALSAAGGMDSRGRRSSAVAERQQ